MGSGAESPPPALGVQVGPRFATIRRMFLLVWIGFAVVMLAGLVAARLGGWAIDVVQTSSMNPALPRGSVALVHPAEPQSISVGDVVAFHPTDEPGRTILHRITSVTSANGGLVFHTKGDANPDPDAAPITVNSIEGRMGWHVSRLGAIAVLLVRPIGPVLLVGIPLLFLLASEGRRAFRTRRALEPDLEGPSAADALGRV